MNAALRGIAASMTALAATAAPSANALETPHIDLYFIPSATVEASAKGYETAEDDGNGFGASAYVPLGAQQMFLITGEYQTTEYDLAPEVNQFRAGLGVQLPLQTLTLAGYGEYVNYDFDGADADGLGLQGRLSAPISDFASVYAQAGYIFLEDDYGEVQGPEFRVGAAIDITPSVGVFADFRHTELQVTDTVYTDSQTTSDADITTTFQDFRVGVRLLFGSI